MSTSRDHFLDNVRKALRAGSDADSGSAAVSGLASIDTPDVESLARDALESARGNGAALFAKFQDSAERAGCVVSRVQRLEAATEHIGSTVENLGARTVVRSNHAILGQMGIDAILSAAGVQVVQMAGSETADERLNGQVLRDKTASADIGITGVDYAIAETGSCVIIPRLGVSRMVSLLPPVHIAVVEAGQVLPGLDELFLLRSRDFLRQDAGGYMNIITGPSRSADIEYTIVKGVHGPGEVHLILIG